MSWEAHPRHDEHRSLCVVDADRSHLRGRHQHEAANF